MTARLDNSRNPMTITAPTGGIAAGSFVLIQGILFFCPEAIAAGQTGTGYWTKKVVRGAPKTTGSSWTKGQKLYWNNTTKKLTTASTGNTLRGFAAEGATSDAETGDFEFCQLPA